MNKPTSRRPNITAFCYQEGDIHFGKKVPDHALPILSGPSNAVRDVIAKSCKRGIFSDKFYPMIEDVNASFKRGGCQLKRVDMLIRFVRKLEVKHADKKLKFFA